MRNSFVSVQIIIIWVLLCAIKMMMTKKTSRVEHYHHHYLIMIRPWRTERARVREEEGHFCWIKPNNEKSRKLGLPKFDMNKYFSTFFFFLFFPLCIPTSWQISLLAQLEASLLSKSHYLLISFKNVQISMSRLYWQNQPTFLWRTWR